jgi:hypothetical protein
MDPYLQAKLYMPLRYLYVSYFDYNLQKQSIKLRTFYMTKQNSSVLTLGDQNSQRWKRFISENSIKNGSIPPPVTRIEGWKWIKGDDADLRSKKKSTDRI